MKFKYHILKAANFYFLLFNFTRWHFSCRPWIYEYWEEQTGKFTKEEKEILKKLKKLQEKYKFSLWQNFLVEEIDQALLNLKKHISNNELEVFRDAFDIFEERFQKIWEIEGKNLMLWKKKLERTDTKAKHIKLALDSYFGIKGQDEINILLLFGGDNASGGGGSNIKEGWVEQEIGLKARDTLPFLLVFWHEYIHNAYKNISNKLIEDYLKNHKIEKEIFDLGYKNSERSVLNEPLTSELFPYGYLAIKYFETKNATELSDNFLNWLKEKPRDIYTAQKYIGARNYKQIEGYFVDKKKIDIEVLEEIHRGYLEYINFIDNNI